MMFVYHHSLAGKHSYEDAMDILLIYQHIYCICSENQYTSKKMNIALDREREKEIGLESQIMLEISLPISFTVKIQELLSLGVTLEQQTFIEEELSIGDWIQMKNLTMKTHQIQG